MIDRRCKASVAEDAPVLWYANRGSGFVLLGLLTFTTVAGVLAGAVPGSREWPRAATQAMHRNVGLLSVAFLAVHAVTVASTSSSTCGGGRRSCRSPARTSATGSVSAWSPSTCSPLSIITSLLRHRLGHRLWRGIHVFSTSPGRSARSTASAWAPTPPRGGASRSPRRARWPSPQRSVPDW